MVMALYTIFVVIGDNAQSFLAKKFYLIKAAYYAIPAKAGSNIEDSVILLDSRFRGNDIVLMRRSWFFAAFVCAVLTAVCVSFSM